MIFSLIPYLIGLTVFAAPAPTALILDRQKSIQVFHRETLPVLVCEKNSYFTECFPDVHTRCEKVVRDLAATCLDQNKNWIDLKLSEPDFNRARRSVNIRVGGCIGNAFETKFASEKSGERKCRSEKNWQ